MIRVLGARRCTLPKRSVLRCAGCALSSPTWQGGRKGVYNEPCCGITGVPRPSNHGTSPSTSETRHNKARDTRCNAAFRHYVLREGDPS